MQSQETLKRLYHELEILDLFEFVDDPETNLPGMHVFYTGDLMDENEGEGEFRVYHADGYCFNISKTIETDEGADPIGEDCFYYAFTQPFDGFRNDLKPEQAIELIRVSVAKARAKYPQL